MNLDYRRFRAAVFVAQEQSFSNAAKRLHVTQPALSAQIRSLETDLGFSLFKRSTRSVSLTSLGARFVEEANRLVSEYERLDRFAAALRREADDHLTIGAALYTIEFTERAKYFERLFEEWPERTVSVVSLGTQIDVVDALTTGSLDMAILMGIPVSAEQYASAITQKTGHEGLYNQDLRLQLLGCRPISLLIPDESPLSRPKVLRSKHLAGQRIAIMSQRHGALLYNPIARYLEEAGAELVEPPESNAIGVERYARQFRIPAVSLGWFPQPSPQDMISKPLAELKMNTQLVLASHPEVHTPMVERALSLARQIGGHT